MQMNKWNLEDTLQPAAFVQGNNKQRYFIEVELTEFFEFRQVAMEDLHWMQSRTFNWNCETH